VSRRLHGVGDVSALPDYGFGPGSLSWWAVVGFMLIEGIAFVLAIGAYYYLLPNETVWPPTAPPPPLLWSTTATALFVATEPLNVWVKRQGQRERSGPAWLGLVLMTVLGIALIALRFAVFGALNVRWDRSAYGSIVWALLLLHTIHLITDVWDTGVLAVITRVKGFDGRKFGDVADNALYWHFIVWSWVVLYLVVYWTPRWM